jgi:hypothetical protein
MTDSLLHNTRPKSHGLVAGCPEPLVAASPDLTISSIILSMPYPCQVGLHGHDGLPRLGAGRRSRRIISLLLILGRLFLSFDGREQRMNTRKMLPRTVCIFFVYGVLANYKYLSPSCRKRSLRRWEGGIYSFSSFSTAADDADHSRTYLSQHP